MRVIFVRQGELNRVLLAVLALASAPITAPAIAVADDLAERDENERLRAALHQLGAPQREALKLAFFSGMTQEIRRAPQAK